MYRDVVQGGFKKKEIEDDGGKKKGKALGNSSLIDVVFSWSLGDVLNEHLYRHKVPHSQSLGTNM